MRAVLILDRYLLRQFVQIFVICFVSFTGLFIVIDAFGHLDHFSAHAEENGGLFAVMGKYYAYRALGIFDRTGSVLAMIAAMFTIAWLERHNELTAMMAAGISKFRIVKPVIVAAICVSLLGVANRELVIPQVRDELARDTKNLGGDAARDLEARFDNRTGVLIGGEKVVVTERRILNPTIVLPSGLDRYGKQLVARNAYFMPANGDHGAGYLLRGVTAPESLARRPSLELDGYAVVITPRDASWLKPGQAFLQSEVPFQMLASGASWRQYAATGELIAELNSPSTELGADVKVTVHTRLVQPLMDGTLLMLGLPLMFSRRNRNVFLSIGVCILIAVTFSLTALACQSLGGLNLLRPTLAAWLPLLVFTPLAVGMSHTLRT